MEHSGANPTETPPALDRIEAALARMIAALQQAEANKQAQASQNAQLEGDNARLREAVNAAIAQIDGLIERVEEGDPA